MYDFINYINKDVSMVATVALLLFIASVILVIYDIFVLRKMRNRLYRDIFINENSIHKSLHIIQKDIHTYIEHLKHTKSKRMLTSEEEIFMSHFEDRVKSLYSAIDRR